MDNKKQVSIKFFDPNANHFYERGDHTIDYKSLFARFELITVFSLDGEEVDEDKEEEINFKMRGIMLGESSMELMKKRTSENMLKVHKKRKTNAWRRGKPGK